MQYIEKQSLDTVFVSSVPEHSEGLLQSLE